MICTSSGMINRPVSASVNCVGGGWSGDGGRRVRLRVGEEVVDG